MGTAREDQRKDMVARQGRERELVRWRRLNPSYLLYFRGRLYVPDDPGRKKQRLNGVERFVGCGRGEYAQELGLHYGAAEFFVQFASECVWRRFSVVQFSSGLHKKFRIALLDQKDTAILIGNNGRSDADRRRRS